MLTLFDELYLVPVYEEKGTVVPSATKKLRYGLAGAILAELALQNRVRVDSNHRLELVDSTLTGDSLLDEALKKIQAEGKQRKLSYWVSMFNEKPKKVRKRMLKHLETQGVIRQEDSQVHWVIPFNNIPDQNASAKYWVKERMRDLALTIQEPDLRTLSLLGLVRASRMMKFVFTKDERKAASQRIYELIVGEALKNETAQSIEEILDVVETQAVGS